MEKKNTYPFEFSVIMAVYNVEPFLRIAIDSVINQDVGFKENIQLILVDDGSVDGSGEICDEYAMQYPNNIIVCHKENGGVSSARNLGLTFATGRYLNFMDSDDKISHITMRYAKDFFEEHGEVTDVVSFRMKYFDGQKGEHILNGKFNGGNRVIYLEDNWQVIQLSASSCFIRAAAAKDLHFCEELAYAEDAREVNKVLLKKKTLGVMKKPVYWYRRRSQGSLSAIQGSESNKRWYHEYLRNFSLYILKYAKDTLGYCPLFIQQAVMYDLQWRIKKDNFPAGLFTAEEEKEYFDLLSETLNLIEDKVIHKQKNLKVEHKARVFSLKYNLPIEVKSFGPNKCFAACGALELRDLRKERLHFSFMDIGRDVLRIEGVSYSILPDTIDLQIYAEVNGERYLCEKTNNQRLFKSLGTTILREDGFVVDVPLKNSDEFQISFVSVWDGHPVTRNNLTFGQFCPISKRYESSYGVSNGWIVKHYENKLILEKSTFSKLINNEVEFCKEIWKKNEAGGKKAIPVRLAAQVLRRLKRKPLWLITDRISKADDNGEAFFVYMQKHHKKEVRTLFTLSEESVDYERLKKIGPTVPYRGFWHKLLDLIADSIVSSAGDDFIQNPFDSRHIFYKDLLYSQNFIFLQHGIIKDDLSSWLKRSNKNLAGFVTSAKPEWESIVTNPNYDYSKDKVWLTGLPRYDRLYHNEQKQITIAPTWRRYLMEFRDLDWVPKSGFKESSFYEFYQKLLQNQALLEAAEKYGYTINFMPHPNVMSCLPCFDIPEQVHVLGYDTKYRDMFAQSDLFVTDYSSTFFDFAYLRKPVIYTHFDYEEFRSAGHAYDEGYFNYERDGFGEVEYDLDSTVNRIIEYMENGCQLKDMYRERIDSFFAFNDQNNCERIYERIMELK